MWELLVKLGVPGDDDRDRGCNGLFHVEGSKRGHKARFGSLAFNKDETCRAIIRTGRPQAGKFLYLAQGFLKDAPGKP